MKSIRFISILLCVAILVFTVAPQTAYAQNSDDNNANPVANAGTESSPLSASASSTTKVKVSWSIPDVEISFDSTYKWDVNTLTWIENSSGGYQVKNNPAVFTIENQSDVDINAKIEFAVEPSLCNIAQGATITYGSGKPLTKKGVDISAAINSSIPTIETITAIVNILGNADFSTLSTTNGAKLGTYSITLRNADYPLEQIYDNYVQGLTDGTISAFRTPTANYTVAQILGSLQAQSGGAYKIGLMSSDYSTSDFDKLSNHLALTLKVALEYFNTDDTSAKAELLDAVLGLVKYWVNQDYQSANWWYNDISTPNLLGEIALLIRDDIPDEMMPGILAIIGDGCLTVNTSRQSETGANATWLAYSTLKYGILSNNDSVIAYAINKLKSSLSYSTGEGIRSDGSFMQNGARLYSGGYGQKFIKNTAYLLYLINGTTYQLSTSELGALSNMILSGLRYISIGNKVDPQTVGSSVSVKGSTNLDIANYLKLITANSAIPSKTAINSYANTILNNTRSDYGLHYYPESKLIVINNSDFYFSFKGCAADLTYGESLNGANTLGYNTSFGTTTTIAGTKVDFDTLQPVLDYSLIPGTTAIYENDTQLKAHTDFTDRTLSGIFGEKYDTGYAVSFAKSSHEKVSYTVACFATDSSAIILGAGLTNTDSAVMYTTLQQEIANGTHTANGNVYTHNGVKYTVYSGGEVTAETKNQTGSWSRNNASGSTSSVTQSVFTLKMANTGSYAYSVMSTGTNETYEVICNTAEVQAVKMPDGSIIGISYVGFGSFEYGGKEYNIGHSGAIKVFD